MNTGTVGVQPTTCGAGTAVVTIPVDGSAITCASAGGSVPTPANTFQASNPSATGFVGAGGVTIIQTSISPTAFQGSGLNDCTFTGTYTDFLANPQALFRAVIHTTGAPDTFEWNKNDGAFSAPVNLTAGVHLLSDGISFSCSATTGHTLSDEWDATPNRTIQIGPTPNFGVPAKALTDDLRIVTNEGVPNAPELKGNSSWWSFGNGGNTLGYAFNFFTAGGTALAPVVPQSFAEAFVLRSLGWNGTSWQSDNNNQIMTYVDDGGLPGDGSVPFDACVGGTGDFSGHNSVALDFKLNGNAYLITANNCESGGHEAFVHRGVSAPVWYFTQIGSDANCSSTTSPAVCGSAAAGSVVIAAGATTVQVNTSAVTANSQIFVFPDETLGTKLSVTCNSTLATAAAGLAITSRSAGTSFTISTLATVAVNPVCLSYLVVN